MKQYRKFIYWPDPDQFERLKKELKAQGLEMKKAKKAVCVPLAVNVDVGFVEPDSWDRYEICRRQLSWYFTSPFAGKYLVVSSRDLSEYGLEAEAVITRSDFKTKDFPKDPGKKDMIQRPSYINARPEAWEDIKGAERKASARGMPVMGLGGMTFERLFLTHCANHANFIEPEYFISENGDKVPYSIGKTRQVCSACLEFFNIIGQQHKKKLVAPCPGAALFAGLPANKYLEVTSL